jgi:hypothetical protein
MHKNECEPTGTISELIQYKAYKFLPIKTSLQKEVFSNRRKSRELLSFLVPNNDRIHSDEDRHYSTPDIAEN